MQCLYSKPIKYEFPEYSRGRALRFAIAPRAPWGGYDFIVNDVPYYQRARNTFVDDKTLRCRGARPMQRTTHNFNYQSSLEDLKSVNQSETMVSFSGSKYLPGPLPRASPAINQHYYRHKIFDSDEYIATEKLSVTKEIYGSKDIPSREDAYSDMMKNMNRMDGKDVKLALKNPEPTDHPYRSSYSSAHNQMNKFKLVPAKSRIYNSEFTNSGSLFAGPMHPRPKTAPNFAVQFKRTSGNRILSAKRLDQPLVLN